MVLRFILVLIVLSVVQSATKKPEWNGSFGGFRININPDGTYSISVNNVTWLNSAPTFFHADGLRHEAGINLKLTNITSNHGSDKLGQWTRTNFYYLAGAAQIVASIKTYINESIPVVLFSQHYVNGASFTTTIDKDFTISSFPGFKIERTKLPLGFLSYGGIMFGDTEKKIGNWSYGSLKINSGIKGGPLALFDSSGNAVIISTANKFMSTSVWQEDLREQGGAVHWGTMGRVNTVPAGHTVDTVIFYHNGGINKAMEGWGEYLRYRYNKDDSYLKSDLTINYLGYWTDAGAYYYYNTEVEKNYQQTMLDVYSYINQIKVPYRYLQYDSWWYYKGITHGVKTWVARPDVFPQGSQYIFNKTGLPVSAHNRYWDRDTTYAKQNGGDYDFIVGLLKAVPMDVKLWNHIFTEARKWGLVTYEQDWLNDEFSGMEALIADINNAKKWLNLMGQGAMENKINILYSMSNPRHAMQTLEIPVVTQARASDDYKPGNSQWKIGISSMFAHAMGVAPFKDTFWTAESQPGNPYNKSEPNTRLQGFVATISTGPVGPSDKIGLHNVSLIMRCCNDDGLILKPSKPARAIDSQIYQSAFGSGGPIGEVWTTYSNIGIIDARHFGIILAAEIKNTFQLTPSLAGFGNITGYKVFSMNNPQQLSDFTESSPITITPECTTVDFCVYYISPIIKTSPEIVILGELSKWVPVSPQRVQEINQSDDIIITITGKQSESVTFSFSVDGIIRSIDCTLGSSGTAQIYVRAMSCVSSESSPPRV